MTPVSRRGVPTQLRAWKKGEDLRRQFLSGVSLHAHTHHSHQQPSGAPVSPRAVFDSEVAQISQLGLSSIVSVTDHHSLTAGFELQKAFGSRCTPLSCEWTMPSGQGVLYIGVHNLPASTARIWLERLAGFTANPGVEPLGGLLEALSSVDDILLVLNHPLWDPAALGADRHQRAVRRVLQQFGHLFHALELNGCRPWGENLDVIALARETGHPLISGGDRHGCEPNALINLSHAGSFAGFVHEVRAGISTVITMPAYLEHTLGPTVASAAHVAAAFSQYP